MNRRFFCILLFALILFLFPHPVHAAEPDFADEIDTDPILDALPEEARRLLSAGGFSPEEMNPTGFQDFLFEIAGTLTDSISQPIRTGVLLLSLILLLRIVLEIAPHGLHTAANLCGGLIVSSLMLTPIAGLIHTAEQVLGVLSNLLAASVPVYASILVLSGNTLTGTTYGALTLTAGNLITTACRNAVIPLTRIFLALSVAASISDFRLKSWTDMLYRGTKWLLVFSVTVFTGVLSIQTVLSAQSDSAAGKAIKMVASGTIPFVGSAFGDAFALLSTSVGMLKSGIGAFGLLAVLAVFLPSVLRCSLWMCIGAIAGFAADLFELRSMSDLLSGCVSAIKMLLAVLFGCGLSGMIAAGILLCVRSAYG